MMKPLTWCAQSRRKKENLKGVTFFIPHSPPITKAHKLENEKKLGPY